MPAREGGEVADSGASLDDGAATKQCPFCAETIKAAAVKCRYCQSDLAGGPAPSAEQPPPPPPVVPVTSVPPRRVRGATGPTPGTAATAASRRTSSPGERRSLRSWPGWLQGLAVLALVLTLAFVALAVRSWLQATELEEAEDAGRAVQASVAGQVEALLSYGHATFDKDLEAAEREMTDSFREEYAPTVEEIRERALAQRRVQEADVIAVSVVSESPDEVKTLVFVNTVSFREGSDQQRVMQNRVNVTVVRRDGDWLVDDLSVPQS